MAVAPGKTCAWAKIGDLCVYISAKRPPLDADWTAYLNWLRENGKPNAERPEFLSFVYDHSSGPSPTQRKQLNDITAGWKMRVAVLTPSAVARGIVTAMNWFKKDAYEAFTPDDFDRAVAFLGVPAALVNELKQTVQKLTIALDA